MKFNSVVPFLSTSLLVSATRISVTRTRTHSSKLQPRQVITDGSLDLNSIHDLIYMADITIAGKDYNVQLDTGSSDLWVKADTSPIPGAQHTDIIHNITYAIGWASGTVAYAPVTFADLSVASQAFLDAAQVKNPALQYGAQGIVGLGFTSLSTIDALLNQKGSDTGRALLYNLFVQDVTEPNFIAFALQRSTQPDDEVEGSFAVGEYEPEYVAVRNTPKIPTWPVTHPSRWNILLDALIVGDRIIPVETDIDEAPSNKAVILMDSGSSLTYAPGSVCEAIYGNITGAHFDSQQGYWIVPCDYEINMALQIGGVIYPAHPLDVSPKGLLKPDECLGSFVPTNLDLGKREFDMLVGDNFLRSVYSVYDFGDFDESGKMGDPYMQLLSLVDPDEASKDFAQNRGSQPKTNITYVGLNGTMIQPLFSLSTQANQTLDTIGKFFPAILGIAALNALVVLVVVIGAVVYMCRKRQRATRTARVPRGRQTHMELNSVSSYVAGMPGPIHSHTYAPVSMALTEDSFVPPSPAFHSDGLQSGERPKSIA